MASKTSKKGYGSNLRVMGANDGAVHLRIEHRQQLRDLMLLINHHRSLMAQIDAEAAHIVNVAYGIDIRQGQWNINLEQGTITPVASVSASPEGDMAPPSGGE